MKTIILASSGQFLASNNVDQYLPKPLRESKILYVTTASNNATDRNFIDETKKMFEELGASYTEFDIVGKSEEELEKALSNADIIYIEGGNTFYLLKAIRETGFNKLIKEAVNHGVIYWGVSAGSYVACPSIIVAAWRAERERFGVTDLTALNLVPFVVKAHYKPEMLEVLKEKSKDLQYPLHILNDEQAIVVRDGMDEFVGGEEIIIK